MSNSIKSILIVGGGTAGWMTALFLNRFLDPAKCRITLLESADLGTIGVGEATVPPLTAFLRLMGIAEDEFLVRCNATYKLGIKFIGWKNGNDAIWHPFGHVGAGVIEGVPLFHHWLKHKRLGHDQSAYTSYSLQATMGELGRAPRELDRGSAVTQQGAYAFHLDAQAFAQYVAEIGRRRGVQHIVDNAGEIVLDERGFIRSVGTAQHGVQSADLYIDCSGFSGLLIEKTLGDRHIDWSRYLFCDNAVVMPLPRESQPPPYTRATALSAGWAWRIPLAHRSGCGYVYSSRFVSQEQATREFVAHNGADPDKCDPRHIRMRVGRRENFWLRNCVAIGLSAGFLEPLESTGLFLIQKGIESLLDHFPDTTFDPALIRHYNTQMGGVFGEVRDFIVLHYALNQRVDEGFWRANRDAALPSSLSQTLAYYERTGLVDWERRALFQEPSFYALASGFDRLPRTHHPMADYADEHRVWQTMQTIKAQNIALAQSMPAHGALIEALAKARSPAAR
jgi:tryptophan halogenase